MEIETPCVKLCVIDAGAGLCRGCGRSAAEIAAWTSMTGERRRALMSELPARMRQADLLPVPSTIAKQV